MGAQEIIQRYVIPTHRANARLVSAEPSPEAARAAYEQAAAVFDPRLNDGSTRVNTDAGRGLLEYQAGGDVFEEWITSVVLGVTSLSRMNTEALAQGRRVPEPMHNYEAFGLSAFRAPKGQLKKHEKLFATMTASIRVNRGWEQAIAAHQRKMHQINRKGIRDRAAITRQTNEEIREMMSDSWEKQQASQDRIAAAFTRTIRGVEEYVDPTTHERIDLTDRSHPRLRERLDQRSRGVHSLRAGRLRPESALVAGLATIESGAVARDGRLRRIALARPTPRPRGGTRFLWVTGSVTVTLVG